MKILRVLKPPCGHAVRKMAAMLTLAVGLPRLPMFDAVYSPLRFMEPWVYGIVMTVLGLALYITSSRRLTAVGRVIAATGFTMWIVLAAATSSTTSFLIDLVVASVLLAEVWAQRDRCSDDS